MKARESFFFGMIPVLFPILSDRCRNSVVFFNYCFTDTHLTAFGGFRLKKHCIHASVRHLVNHFKTNCPCSSAQFSHSNCNSAIQVSVDAKTAAMEEFVFLILLRVRTVACKTYHSAKQKAKGT